MKLLETIISLLCCYHTVANGDELLTKTDKGTIKGSYRKTINGKQFVAFTGIPYAKPPIGKLRFKPAVEAEPWIGILDASKPHNMCTQIDSLFGETVAKGNEDCLYLNVYRPQGAQLKNERLPVLFYIHGGGFFSGAANPDLYGPDILLDKDVVLVTTNYRLGALGFLSTEDEVVPGNNGLKDQVLALKWTKKNIITFGGNPTKITIFGQSAGGSSAHFHVLSPLSKGLFSGAIAHSGSAVAAWAIAPKGEGLRNAKKLARLLNCPTESNNDLVDCLRNIDSYDIVEQDKAFMEYQYHPIIPFKPVVESNGKDAFITKHPVDIIRSGAVSNVPLMFGITTNDGAFVSAGLYNNSKLIERLNKDFDKILPVIINYGTTTTSEDKDYITTRIKHFYFNNKPVDGTTRSKITNVYTDAWFFHPQNLATHLHNKFTYVPVYYFVFGYKGSISLTPFFGEKTYDYGVCHGDDLNYIMSSDLFGVYKPTDSDKKIIDLLTTMWVNFADTCDPTSSFDDVIKTKWTPNINEGDILYYFIKNENETEMVKNIYSERAKFWERLPLDSKRIRTKIEL